jgi:hypothetical protein
MLAKCPKEENDIFPNPCPKFITQGQEGKFLPCPWDRVSLRTERRVGRRKRNRSVTGRFFPDQHLSNRILVPTNTRDGQHGSE